MGPDITRLSTNITLEDIDKRLSRESTVKSKDKGKVVTWATHNMKPTYGSLISYRRESSGEYVTLLNGAKEPIVCYIKTLVLLGGKSLEKRNMFHVLVLRAPLYFMRQKRILLG